MACFVPRGSEFDPRLPQSVGWSKPWPNLHMTLAVGRTLNTNSLTHSLNCNSSFDVSFGKSEDADEMQHHASSEPAPFAQTHQSSE